MPGGRRIRERTTSHREAPFPRRVFAAEWDDPARCGSVTRWWFGTRDEALAALKGPGPFATRLLNSPARDHHEPWRLT
jgi:hypothetical protein